jgi:hypothetical protein
MSVHPTGLVHPGDSAVAACGSLVANGEHFRAAIEAVHECGANKDGLRALKRCITALTRNA